MYDPHDDMDFPDSGDLPPDDDPMTPEDSDTLTLTKVCIIG